MTKELTIIDQAKQNIIRNGRAFKAVLPDTFPVDKFIATFCLEVQKNPKLAQCTNLIEVARDVASFGLIIGGLAGQSYLIPFEKKKKEGTKWTTEVIAQLIIGYKGYITKLEEAGYTVEVELVTNEEVENERFEEVRGSDPKITHRPIRKGIRNRDNIALAYCIIRGKDKDSVISVLSREEIEEMAKTEKWLGSKETKDLRKERTLGNVWTQEQRATDFGQMCLKTVIRNCVKRVNLKIVNEMSAYEGQRDVQILKDITPLSKTADAHTPQKLPENPPAAIEEAFLPKTPFEAAIESVSLTEDEKQAILQQELSGGENV